MQVTVIPNLKHKEQLSSLMLVKGNQWKELGCKSSWMVWEKGHD